MERLGNDGGYPNGGIWRFTADQSEQSGSVAAVVKRTGPHHLGTFQVWRGRFAPDDPHWWGREAAFYESDLATSGWTSDVRAARCYAIDDHDACRDIWLEPVGVPASLESCERAVAGLARWQVANAGTSYSWLSEDWIPTHVGRQGLDNHRTYEHPAWQAAIGRGLDPALRDLVKERVTDPAGVRNRLTEFPFALTHFDFHANNIGTAGADVVIIDWAYVGWGPIGHDVGHLALDIEDAHVPPSEIWNSLQAAYCDELVAAGWTGDLDVVRRSMAVSSILRLGWTIDHLLNVAGQIPDDMLAAMSAKIRFLAELG